MSKSYGIKLVIMAKKEEIIEKYTKKATARILAEV